MAAKSTTQVAWINGAAKDDNVIVNTPGILNSIHGFTIGNLLANDPGSSTFYDAISYDVGMTDWQALNASTKTQVSVAPGTHGNLTKFTITTEHGGTVCVNKTTGALTYTPPDAAHGGPTQDQITALGAGEAWTDSFFYVIFVGNKGAYSLAKATLSIAGVNDAPLITSSEVHGSVYEDGTEAAAQTPAVTGASSVLTGTLTWTDPDITDTHTFVASASANGYGTTTMDASGNWSYTAVDSGAVDALAVGETLTDSFTITVNDNHGGTASQTVYVTIIGTNDAPTITSGDQSALVYENPSEATDTSTPAGASTGTVTFNDVDASDSHVLSVSTQGAHGVGTVDQAGNWSYTATDNGDVNALRANETMADSFVVQVDDGHGGIATQTVNVTIIGTNDAAVFGGDITGSVTEDANTSTGGTITVNDPDHDESHFVDWVPDDLHGLYGVFTFDEDTGAWTYAVDNNAIQGLNTGDTLVDTLTVFSTDGSHQDINVTINGVDEPPTIVDPVDHFLVKRGGNDVNGQVINGFDSNDMLNYAMNLMFTGSITDNGTDTFVTFQYKQGNSGFAAFVVTLVGYVGLDAAHIMGVNGHV